MNNQHPITKKRIQSIGANASWLIGVRIFRMFIGIVVIGAVARYLGPDRFGVLNYAIGLTAIFSALANLSLEGIVVRELVSHPTQSSQLLGTSFGLRLAGSLGAMLLIMLVSVCTQNEGNFTVISLIISMAFLPSSLEVIELWFQKGVQAKHTVIARIASTLIVAALRLIFVSYEAPLEVFAAMQFIDALIGGLALMVAFKIRGQKVTCWSFDLPLACRMLRECWPLVFSGLLLSACSRVDQVLVKEVLGDRNMGVYYSALRISEVWGIIPSALLTTVYPILVAKRAAEPEKFNARLQTMFDLLTGVGYTIAVTITLSGSLLVPFIFGTEYKAAVPILLIQAWNAPVVCSALARAQCMLLEKQTLFYTPIAFLYLSMNIPLALFLMERFGTVGAASSVLISSIFSGYLTSFMFPALRPCGVVQTRAFLLPFRLGDIYRTVKHYR